MNHGHLDADDGVQQHKDPSVAEDLLVLQEGDLDQVAMDVDTVNETFLYNMGMAEFDASEEASIDNISFAMLIYEWEPQEDDEAPQELVVHEQVVDAIPEEVVIVKDNHDLYFQQDPDETALG